MKEKSLLILMFLLLLFVDTGCKEADSVLVPIETTTREVQKKSEKINIPIAGMDNTNMHFKNTKFVIEKNF